MPRFAILAAILLCPLFASAHDGHADDPIKARRAYFTLIGTNMGVLGAMAREKMPYDSAMAERHAQNLAALTRYDASVHFPAGTSNRDHPGKTRALPAIWQGEGGYNPDFLARDDAFVDAVAEMQDQAGQGRVELAVTLGFVGRTCKGCHDDFRAKDF